MRREHIKPMEQGYSLVEALCVLFLMSSFLLFCIPLYGNIERLSESILLEKEARIILTREMKLQEKAENDKRYFIKSTLNDRVRFEVELQVIPLNRGREVQGKIRWQDLLQRKQMISQRKVMFQPEEKGDLPM